MPNIAFWHSKSYLDIRIGPNISSWYSKSYMYFDLRIQAEYRILTFETQFWHSNFGKIPNFDIRNPILTFEFGSNNVFHHSRSCFDIQIQEKISRFDIRNAIFIFELGQISHFDIQNTILSFELGPNIEFWHSKSYFDVATWPEYFILTSNSGRIPHFDNLNSYFNVRIRADSFLHLKSCFETRI